jgi:hypothetical protein
MAANGGNAAVVLAADQRIFGVFTSGGGGVRGLVTLWRQGGLKLSSHGPGLFQVGWWYLTSGRQLMRSRREKR